MFNIIPLPYAVDALEPHIDALTMEIHHDRHHQTYATNLNNLVSAHQSYFENKSIEQILSNINEVPADIRQGVINNGGGLANHDLFWTILSPNGGGNPTGKIADKIKEKFGDYEAFKTALTQAGLTRFGSGWAWLVVDGAGEIEVISTLNQDSPLMQGLTPILGLDVWEHAYYLNYQNKRPDYIAAFFHLINWDEVNRRFDQATKN